MDFKVSTYSESSKPMEVPVQSAETIPAAVNTPTEQTPVSTQVAEQTSTVVNEEGKLENSAPPPTETLGAATETTSDEVANSFELAMPTFENNGSNEQAATEPQNNTTLNWEEAIKSVDRKAILQKVGVSDFAIELDEHIKKGGQAIDYLMARAIDYNKVTDIDLIKSDFDKKYHGLSPEERSTLFNDVYKQSEYDDDTQKAIGLIRMKADAQELRQKKIAEQQSFKIPENVQPEQIQQQPNYGEQAESTKRYIQENEATQAFMQSKRVAIPLGEKDSFNFNISDPNYLLRVMTDKELWAKHLTDKQGEPDINRMIRVAKYAVDPDAHDMQIFNYGQQKGERKKVEGNQYISKPVVKTGMPTNETLGQAFAKRAKVSTYGG